MGGKLFLVVAALAVAVVICEEEVSKESLMAMSKDELVKALTESHTETDKAQSQLLQAKKKMRSMKRQISDFEGKPFNEKRREQRELKKKKNEKKAEMAKRAEVLKKKEKLSDLLMNHGANFLAEKVAKDTKSKGSIKQKAAVRKAAIEGARAGATGPLRKVARAAAIKAVKATRLEDKKKIRQMTTKAAKAAVKKLLDEQEAMVQKAADKWVEEAIKKHPATVMLAEHEDKPNHSTAPPVIHLSLDDNSAANQVQQLKEDSKKHSPEKAEKKPEVVHISLGADPAKKSKKHETVAKAASKAKKAAGKIVKEH